MSRMKIKVIKKEFVKWASKEGLTDAEAKFADWTNKETILGNHSGACFYAGYKAGYNQAKVEKDLIEGIQIKALRDKFRKTKYR